MGLTVESADVSSEDDRDLGIMVQDRADDVIDMRGLGGGKEEDSKGLDGIGWSDFREILEPRADREANDLNFFGWEFLSEEAFAGVIVGDEKVIARRFGPGGIDFDGVRNHGDDGDTCSCLELSLYHVRV